jgi:arsenate reductase
LKGLGEFTGREIHLEITVCDGAREACPFFPGVRELIHSSFEDPSRFHGREPGRLEAFRGVRDEIRI